MADKRTAKYGRGGVPVTSNDPPLARATKTKQPKQTATQPGTAVSPAQRTGVLRATETKRQAAAAAPAQPLSASSASRQPLEGPHGVVVPEDNPPFPPPKRMKTAVVVKHLTRHIIVDGQVIKKKEQCTEYFKQIEVDEAGLPLKLPTDHL